MDDADGQPGFLKTGECGTRQLPEIGLPRSIPPRIAVMPSARG